MLLIQRIASCLAERDGGRLEFVQSPAPCLGEIRNLDGEAQADAVRAVAEFGIFLEKQKASPVAAALLLESLEAMSAELLEGRQS